MEACQDFFLKNIVELLEEIKVKITRDATE